MLLLDTHAVTWLVEGEQLSGAILDDIRRAAVTASVFVSAVTAWEVALLHDKQLRVYAPDPAAWIASLAKLPGIRFVPLDERMALESRRLPGRFHADPADRFLVATARILRVPLVTRDRAILDYAASGHVAAVPC